MAPDEVADYEQLRTVLSPEKSLQVMDDFAKWLFAIAGSVGALATGFGLSHTEQLSGSGQTLFAAATAAVAFSLILAALSRMPLPVRVNRYDDASMRDGLASIVRLRAILLGIAAVSFAAGVGLAGCVPLFS